MHYLALLCGKEEGSGAAPDSPEFAAEVELYAAFEAAAGDAVQGGAALFPSVEGITIRQSGTTQTITDGPFTEQAEVIGGFIVFELENLDEAVELAAKVPAASTGYVEVWPMVEWRTDTGRQSDWWLALLLEPPDAPLTPGSAQWDEGAAEHVKFANAVGDVIRGGGALYPPPTATTVRVRDGKTLLTDGPHPESAEVVNGLYMFSALDKESATEIARQIPTGDKGGIELRQIADLDV